MQFDVPRYLTWLVLKLYNKTKGVLRIASEHTDQFACEKGCRQGCVLSPMLLNTFGEIVMRMLESKTREHVGCINGGRSVWKLGYADDTTLILQDIEMNYFFYLILFARYACTSTYNHVCNQTPRICDRTHFVCDAGTLSVRRWWIANLGHLQYSIREGLLMMWFKE